MIEHFDAVRIGLTATPALHTTEIFGRPIFTYGLREAVIDGWLVDQEPPIRIETELSRDGIHFSTGVGYPAAARSAHRHDRPHDRAGRSRLSRSRASTAGS